VDVAAARNALTGKAQTVLGPVRPEDLGPTMTHEHLVIDLSPLYLQNVPKEASRRAKFYAPLSIELLGALKYGGQTNLDNVRLLDVQTAIEEAMLYKQAGGGTIVDPTNIGLGRDPKALARIARATGLHIVMGASYYVEAAYPQKMDARTEDEIVDEIARDVLVGVDDTGIRSGIIGEVGCSWPMTANERKVLRASGRAQQLTGAPLMIHPGRNEMAPLEIVDVLREVKTDLTRTVMCHLDRTVAEHATLKKLAESGCILQYDLFGTEYSYYRLEPRFDMPSDAQRIQCLAWIIAAGYGSQVTISHDIDAKYSLVRHGGFGYAHILENIVPRMQKKGFQGADIQAIIVDNPRRLLTFA
jgi:phosphotriesterase-related protein